MADLVAWFMTVGTDRYWSGDRDQTFESNTYAAASHVIGISASQLTAGVPESRLTISLYVGEGNVRSDMLQDVGPLPVDLAYASSDDNGDTWTRRYTAKGRLSSPSVVSGVVNFELETAVGYRLTRDIVQDWTAQKGTAWQDMGSSVSVRWPP